MRPSGSTAARVGACELRSPSSMHDREMAMRLTRSDLNLAAPSTVGPSGQEMPVGGG